MRLSPAAGPGPLPMLRFIARPRQLLPGYLGNRAVRGVPASLAQLAGVACSGDTEVTGAESQHVEDRLDADAVVRADPEDLDALPFPFTGPRHLPGRPPAAPEDAGERLQVRGCSQGSDGFSGPAAVA